MECAAESGAPVDELLRALYQWAPWLSEADEGTDHSVLLSASPNGASLWEKLAPMLEGLDVSRIVALGPYFDGKLSLLQLLETRFPEAPVVVGIDPEGAELEPDARVHLRRTRFVDLSGWSPCENHPFPHAKVLWFQTKSAGSLLVSGSANLSAPAWLAQSSARNTELVVARRLDKDSTVPSDLGLPAVLDLPEVASESWEQITLRRANKPNTATGTRAWAATLTRSGLEVDPAFLDGASILKVLDATGEVLAELDLAGGVRHLLDDQPEASFVEVVVDSRSRRALVLHLDELREKSSGKTRQDLRQALGQLSAAGLELESLFTIIEKAIWAESPAAIPEPSGGHASKGKPAGGGGIVIGDIKRRRKNRRSVATGDIALILDALIRRVSEGLLQDVGVKEHVSEEALKVAGDQAPERKPPDRDEAAALAQRCRAKTKRLVDRLGKALRKRAETDEAADPYLSIMQFTAALGLLHQLRLLEGRLDWLPKGESLVDDGAIEAALEVGALWIFAPDDSLAASFANRYGDSYELASSRLLCCWLAYLNGVDVFTRLEMGEEWEPSYLEVTALALNFLDRDALPAWAEIERVLTKDGALWLSRHLDWAEEVLTAPTIPGAIKPGAFVRFTLGGIPRLSIVLQVSDANASVIDRSTGEERRFRCDRLELVGRL
ncbi:MAG TPA: hypothetical protein VGC79_25415, partial [Polyangiaceae bacterium]